jgi:YgiT-type zinc finger domain-containing protein
MQKVHICYRCGGKMHPVVESSEYCYNGVSVIVEDIRVFRCISCGEGILESEEVQKIQNTVLSKSQLLDH